MNDDFFETGAYLSWYIDPLEDPSMLNINEAFERGGFKGWYVLYGDKESLTFQYAVGPLSKSTAKHTERVGNKLIPKFDYLAVSGKRVQIELERVKRRCDEEFMICYEPPERRNSKARIQWESSKFKS
jgi:hypothetical protein